MVSFTPSAAGYPNLLSRNKSFPMANDTSLRKHVLNLLGGGQAHLTFQAAVKNVPVALRGKRPKGVEHSPWEILEHMRIAQWDILEFSRDSKHVSPQWPAG